MKATAVRYGLVWWDERLGLAAHGAGLGGLLAVVVWAVTWLFPRSRSRPRDREDAAGLLDRRFASGDIDEDTYRRMRSELTRTH